MADDKTPSNKESKGKSNDEKTALAGGIAIMVIVILLVSWGFFFVRKIQHGDASLEFGGTGQDEFNFSTVREAQQEIENSFEYSQEELRALREAAASRELPSDVQGIGQESSDQFGVPDGSSL